jgi:hypothetical protein
MRNLGMRNKAHAKGEVHHAGGQPPPLFLEFQISIPLLPSLAPINHFGFMGRIG